MACKLHFFAEKFASKYHDIFAFVGIGSTPATLLVDIGKPLSATTTLPLDCCRVLWIMGLLEYQAMSSLRVITHDGWLCSVYSNWKFHQLAGGQLLSGQPVWLRKNQAVWPVHHLQITPAGSLSSSQPGGLPCKTSPLALRPYCCGWCVCWGGEGVDSIPKTAEKSGLRSMLRPLGADPPPPSTAGKNPLNEEITPLLPTGIDERYSQTISN